MHGVLSGPTYTVILSRYAVTLHSVALGFSRIWRDIAGESRYIPLKGGCSTHLFSSERGCRTSSCLLASVAVQGRVSWKATKEYLNQRGYQNRSFSSVFFGPLPPPLFPSFSPLFPPSGPVHSATTSPLFTSPLFPPFFVSRKTPI